MYSGFLPESVSYFLSPMIGERETERGTEGERETQRQREGRRKGIVFSSSAPREREGGGREVWRGRERGEEGTGGR